MRALVTGGGGFLGKAILKRLLAEGHAVRSIARGDYPELRALGAETLQGDLADPGVATRAVEGCDAVFHVAAKAGVWGAFEEYHRSNVLATQRLIEACLEAGVPRLIYTSTPSVIHGGGDVEGVDESAPYADHYETHYPATKAAAEKMVLAANSARLSTVALRPHLIWGPEDTQLIPRIIDRARSGRLRRIGAEPKLVDSIYIDNAVDAHLLACQRLGPEAACAGRAYFITQGEPVPTWDLVNRILAAAGAPLVTRTVSPKVAYAAGAVMEGIWTLFRVKSEPPMTRFVASQLSTAHWYDVSAARRDLGFTPAVSIDEGLARLKTWFQSNPS